MKYNGRNPGGSRSERMPFCNIFNRWDFAKLTFGALGAALPETKLMMGDATATRADERDTDIAVNNHITHFSRWVRTYRPAIHLQGVGNHAAHNLISDAPHAAVLLSGNNHIIEFNEIHDVALETPDVGAIYMGRDYTQRGNVVRYNYIHDLPLETEVNGIYLDDCWSGTRVHGNVLFRMRRGVLVGGGRDNTLSNNIFVECHPAIRLGQ